MIEGEDFARVELGKNSLGFYTASCLGCLGTKSLAVCAALPNCVTGIGKPLVIFVKPEEVGK